MAYPGRMLKMVGGSSRAVATGGPGGHLTPPPHPLHFLEDQLTLSQPRGADYAHHITMCPPPRFSYLPTALLLVPHARAALLDSLEIFGLPSTYYYWA